MKNIYILSLILFISFMALAMEQNNQLVFLSDLKGSQELLDDVYKTYLANKLEEYKKADISMDPWNMDVLIDEGKKISKQRVAGLKNGIFRMIDKECNSFLHVAVEKNDLETVRWLRPVERSSFYFNRNGSSETPLDLCIKKLLPNISCDQTKRTAEKIFDTILSYVILPGLHCDMIKKLCLKSIIDLQFKYIQYGSTFDVESGLLLQMLPAGPGRNDKLANYYRQKKNEKNGYTLAHIAICRQDPDALFELAKKNHVSFAKDNEGKSTFDRAVDYLKIYTHNTRQITARPESFQKASCCVYILINYARALAFFLRQGQAKGAQDLPDTSSFSYYGSCCKKHEFVAII